MNKHGDEFDNTETQKLHGNEEAETIEIPQVDFKITDDSTHGPKQNNWYYFMVPCAFLVQFFVLGFVNNVGSFKNHWIYDFSYEGRYIDFAGNMNYCMLYMGGIVFLPLSRKIGMGYAFSIGCLMAAIGLLLCTFAPNPLLFFISYGVVLGIGASFMFFTTILIQSRYFIKNKTIIFGIISSGSSLGTLIHSLFVDKLCRKLSWYFVFRIDVIIFVILNLASFVFGMEYFFKKNEKIIDRPLTTSKPVKQNPILLYLRVFKKMSFLIFNIGIFIFMLGYLVPFISIRDFAERKGVPTSQAVTLVGSLSMSSLFGRLLIPLFAEHSQIKKLVILMFSIVVMGIASFLTVFCRSYSSFVLYMCIYGFFEAAYVTLPFPIVEEMFVPPIHDSSLGNLVREVDREKLLEENERAGAVFLLLQAFALLAASPLADAVLSKTQSHQSLFIMTGVCFVIAAVLIGVVRCTKDSEGF